MWAKKRKLEGLRMEKDAEKDYSATGVSCLREIFSFEQKCVRHNGYFFYVLSLKPRKRPNPRKLS